MADGFSALLLCSRQIDRLTHFSLGSHHTRTRPPSLTGRARHPCGPLPVAQLCSSLPPMPSRCVLPSADRTLLGPILSPLPSYPWSACPCVPPDHGLFPVDGVIYAVLHGPLIPSPPLSAHRIARAHFPPIPPPLLHPSVSSQHGPPEAMLHLSRVMLRSPRRLMPMSCFEWGSPYTVLDS